MADQHKKSVTKSGITGEPVGTPPPCWAQRLTCILGTGLGTGYVPKGQGTAGSALFLLLWWLFVPKNRKAEWFTMLLMHVISVPTSAWGERMWGPDPGRVTIDEFAGQAIALLGIPRKPLPMLAAFALFRFFDAWKLPLIRKHVESLPGGWGVTLDDTAAGILARLSLFGLMKLAGIFKN